MKKITNALQKKKKKKKKRKKHQKQPPFDEKKHSRVFRLMGERVGWFWFGSVG